MRIISRFKKDNKIVDEIILSENVEKSTANFFTILANDYIKSNNIKNIEFTIINDYYSLITSCKEANVNHNACLSSTFTMCINDCYGCTTEEIL